jgi:hypothetical protein
MEFYLEPNSGQQTQQKYIFATHRRGVPNYITKEPCCLYYGAWSTTMLANNYTILTFNLVR